MNHRVAEPPKLKATCGVRLAGGCVSWNWLTPPKARAYAELQIIVESPLQDELVVVPWMPNMSPPHGSGVPTIVEQVSEIEYKVSDVYFNMGGPWVVYLRLKRSGQTIEEAVIDVAL